MAEEMSKIFFLLADGRAVLSYYLASIASVMYGNVSTHPLMPTPKALQASPPCPMTICVPASGAGIDPLT